MLTKSLSAVVRLVTQAKASGDLQLYKKSATIEARLSLPGERILTVVHGIVETENTTGEDDIVVRNPTETSEQYTLTLKDFQERYRPSGELRYDEWTPATACGFAYAVAYHGPAFQFTTKWGNTMLVEYNDRLAVSDINDLDSVYRIEKSAFLETYSPVGGSEKIGKPDTES